MPIVAAAAVAVVRLMGIWVHRARRPVVCCVSNDLRDARNRSPRDILRVLSLNGTLLGWYELVTSPPRTTLLSLIICEVIIPEQSNCHD